MPTLLRGQSNSDIPATGLIWLDQNTGRVVRTKLEVGPGRVPAAIVTSFGLEPVLGVHVPREMRDRYPDGMSEIRGVATYGRFRRFEVHTGEEIVGPRP